MWMYTGVCMRPEHIDPFRSVQFCIIILRAVELHFIDESVQPNNVHFFSFLFIYSLTNKKKTHSNPPVEEWFNQAILLSIDDIMFRFMCLYQIDLHSNVEK